MVALLKILELETNPVFTQNFDFLDEQERLWNSCYTNRCKAELNPSPMFPRVAAVARNSVASPCPSPIPPIAAKHTFPIYPYDPAIDGDETTWTVHDEIKVMVNVQAYFQVAYKASTSLRKEQKSDFFHLHSVSLIMCH